MPDTGENREIKQRVNAKEAEIVAEAKKLRQTAEDDHRQDSRHKSARQDDEKNVKDR
jgi:hypothetical protein